MHLKNWSLIYPDGRNAALAPGYDFVSTIAFLPDENMALTFGHSKRWADLSTEELRYFAAKAQLPETIVLDVARRTVRRFREVWAREKSHLELAASTMDLIEKHIRATPLAREIS
jgi:serine/threonine-protein kinase HipA